jgi:hypothetical protein
MMGNADTSLRVHHTLQDSALPAAPMAMPEQVLTRQRSRVTFLKPFFQWLALR